MNCPDIAILTSSDDNIVSDTQHGVDTVGVTRELVTMKTILVLATITLLSISNTYLHFSFDNCILLYTL